LSEPATASDFALWLADAAEQHRDMADLHQALCERLVSNGLPISRSSLGLEILHPELSGWQFVWTSKEVQVLDSQRSVETTTDYLSSPARIVDDTNQPFRRRLVEPSPDLPMLDSLRAAGATDYVIFPLPFLDRHRSAFVSFTTDRIGGFADRQIVALHEASRLLSPWAERHVLKRIAIDLLDTYVGRRSGEQVYNGAIERGTAEIISAVILLADLRGFTRYSDRQEIGMVGLRRLEARQRLLGMLNQWFETMVSVIEAKGGEVLKFMGDGLLAIFVEQDRGLDGASRAAVTAARSAIDAVERLNAERTALGEAKISFGMALHAGDIAYGNIGGRTRLDFTVIGPAVNHTSRLLELSKALEQPVVVSEACAATMADGLSDLGLHRLRDVDEPQRVFALQT
jgi:adenylate cyclase